MTAYVPNLKFSLQDSTTVQSISFLKQFLSQRLDQTELLAENYRMLVYFNTTDHAHDAIKTLGQEHVLSAPVWDPETNTWVGMIDMYDFMHYALFVLEHQRTARPGAELNITVKQIMTLSHHEPLQIVPRSTIVYDILQQFAKGHRHRTLIADAINTKKDVFVVSQYAIVRWLESHRQALGSLARLTVDDLGLLGKPTITISQRATALDALLLLHNNNVHGCGVVDDDNKLVGNFSLTDLKYAANDVQRLLLPIGDYFPHPLESWGLTVVSATNTLVDLIGRFVASKVHRVYTVDSHGLPTSVISLSDVVDTLLYLCSSV